MAEGNVCAWTITKGTVAPGAAGVIHTDFEKASSAPRPSPITTLTLAANARKGRKCARRQGVHVQDGDVMHFRFAN